MNSYVIRGGKEGKERLSLLSQVMLPFTSQFLHRVELDRGMQCLDLGCGGGDVTFLIANMVGSQGKVIGIDCDRESSFSRLISKLKVSRYGKTREISVGF